MKKITYFLPLLLGLAGAPAAQAQDASPVTITEVTEAPADGYYVIHSASNSAGGYLYTTASETNRPFRLADVTLDETLTSEDVRYVWKLTNDADDGTFTLQHYQSGRFVPADAAHNQNMTGTATANLKLEVATDATDGNWFLSQTDNAGDEAQGSTVLYVHTNKASDIDGNWSYWEGASATGTAVRLRLYKLNGDPADLAEPVVEQGFPFKTTTITDGAFAVGTTWYTLQLGASGLYISDNAGADRITLNTVVTELEDADLWCFVGSEEEGFRLYNKAGGPEKALAASTTMGQLSGYGGTGGSTYPTLQTVGNLPDGYTDLWDLAASDKVEYDDETEGQYFLLHGTDYALNNFGGRGDLAFWAEGKDANSTIAVRFAEVTIPIVKGEGTLANVGFTSANWVGSWTYNGEPELSFSTTANNMLRAGDDFVIASGGTRSCIYSFMTSQELVIAGYGFDFRSTNSAATVNVTPSDSAVITSTNSETQSVCVSGLSDRIASFLFADADNSQVTLSNFYAIIRRSLGTSEPFVPVFAYGDVSDHNVQYRIPAIATVGGGDKAGRLVAISDYRYCGADIGNGRIDLHVSVSDDNGATWTTPDLCRDAQGNPVTQGDGEGTVETANDNRDCGFGDAAIVGDRESSRVLMISVCGRTPFWSGRRDNPNGVARWYSEDGGDTWTPFEDITESIYSKFDGTTPNGYIDSMFFGSGRIMQSSRVKVGEYYRLYAVMSGYHAASGVVANWVMYSDNFGQDWAVLGDPMTPPIPSGADEPKAEELPDGSVIVSSRVGGGRNYNIFSYTDVENAEGLWGNKTFSSLAKSSSNACNGEIMVLPVEKIATGEKMYMALQSVPFGPSGRTNVGINYKELNGYDDYGTVENFAAGWDGAKEVSKLGSAYSTMTWQKDNTLAFFYEEDTYGRSYSEVYKNYSIEQITDSLYRYYDDSDNAVADSLTKAVAAVRSEAYGAMEAGRYVGQITAAGIAGIVSAGEAYVAAPSIETYVAFNRAIAEAERIQLENAHVYRLRNVGRADGTLYLTAAADKLTASTFDEQNANLLFGFIDNEDGTWMIFNESRGIYIGATGANEVEIPVTTNADEAVAYRVTLNDEGASALVCTAPTGGNTGIHLAGDNTRLVPWIPGDATNNQGSAWYIEPTDMVLTGIEAVEAAPAVKEVKFYDLQGRRVVQPAKGGIYVTGDRRKVFVK